MSRRAAVQEQRRDGAAADHPGDARLVAVGDAREAAVERAEETAEHARHVRFLTRTQQQRTQGRAEGHRFAFAVIDEASDAVLGSTSYHDILPDVKRIEIGYTWYARRVQRTHVNTTCKLLLLTRAFDTLECNVVGLRTDNFNFASQRAIERLGAKKDGVIRGHAMRRDGTIRDTVMYSLIREEWPSVRAHLSYLLSRAGSR